MKFNNTNHNAILFEQNGGVSAIKINTFKGIAKVISKAHKCNYVEMALLGRYPLNLTSFEDPAKSEELELVRSALDEIVKRKPFVATKKHIQTRLGLLQLFIHEFGALIPLQVNPFFDDGTQNVLYGDVILLLVDCDDLAYE